MEKVIKRTNPVTNLTKHKNMTLKFFGVATIAFGMYVVYLGSDNDVLDVDFKVNRG